MTKEEEAALKEMQGIQEPTPEEALAEMQNIQNPREQSSDPLMGFAQGLVKSAVSSPGQAASIWDSIKNVEPTTNAGKWFAKNIGPYAQQAIESSIIGPLVKAPTSEQTLNQFEKSVAPFKEYTGPAGYAERVGEAYMPGPGGKAQAARDLLAAGGAAVGGKGLSDLGEAFHVGPGVRSALDFIGSLAGGYASRGKAANEVKIAAHGSPTKEALDRATGNAYREIKSVPIQKQPYTDALTELADELPDAGIFPEDTTLADKLGDLNRRPTLTMPEVLSIRQRAGREAKPIPNNPDPHKPLAARMIADKLDDYFTKAAPQDPRFASKIKKAGELGRSKAKSEDFETVMEAGGNVSQMGEAIGKMNEARALAKRTMKSLSPLEKRGLTNVVGRNARNPLRILGRGFQSFLTQGAGAGISAISRDPTAIIATLSLGGIGKAMEGVADRMSMKKLDDVIASIRGGRPKQERATRRATRINKDRNTAARRGILGELRSNAFINTGQEQE